MKKILSLLTTFSLITTSSVTVISCNKNPNPQTAEINKIYQAVNNKNITISDNQLWGNNPDWQNILLSDFKKQLNTTPYNLSSTELKLLWLDPLIKPLYVITKNNQETQFLDILIGHSQDKKTDLKTAVINLTWKLTSDQQPIYPIYKQIPDIIKKIANNNPLGYLNLSNKNLNVFDSSLTTSKGWPVSKKTGEIWNPNWKLTLNNNLFQSNLKTLLFGMKKYKLEIPDDSIKVGVAINENNIKIINNWCII